jgi:S1-C subfamily serine protease
MWGRSVVKILAVSIVLTKGIILYPVMAQAAMSERDVCILHTEGMKLPPAHLGRLAETGEGEEVFVFGYAAAIGLGLVGGKVRALHPFRGSYILETDAEFMRGTSGGAIFTARGELVAMPTFLLKIEEGGYFYGVPVEWVVEVLAMEAEPVSAVEGLAFWEVVDFKPRDRTWVTDSRPGLE